MSLAQTIPQINAIATHARLPRHLAISMRPEPQKLVQVISRRTITSRFCRHQLCRLMVVIYVTFFVFLSANAQTTNDIGFPDPRYSATKALTKFSCSGGLKNRPDGGEYAAVGGNLTITIIEMRNLLDLDGFGLAGLLTDAYIEVSIDDNVRRLGVINNSLNPKWEPSKAKGCTDESDSKRDLNFGFRPAGAEITIEVLNEDSGFEFSDDPIAEITLNAIYCSGFSAISQQTVSDGGSAWKMPKQSLCVEEIWIQLTAESEEGCVLSDGTISTVTPCMRLRTTALPFQMHTEEMFVPNAVVSGGMGDYFPNEDSWLYGRVCSASDTRMLSYFRTDRSTGGLLTRSDSARNNNKGNTTLMRAYGYTPYARVTLNFDAEVFVFRRVGDATSAPEWLNTTFGWTQIREYAQLMGVTGNFRAVAQNFSAHATNAYSDASQNGIVTGANLNQGYKDNTLNMYFIIDAPHESFGVVPATYLKEFSRAVFIEIGLQYLPIFVFIVVLVLRYLKRMNWRIERACSFLAEKVVVDDTKPTTLALKYPGPSSQLAKNKTKKNAGSGANTTTPVEAKKTGASNKDDTGKKTTKPDIVALLFLCYNESPNNVEFRRNLFYATCAIYATMLMPVLLPISWGVTAILLVAPPAFGFGLIFLGTGALAATYALVRWVKLGWRTILRLVALMFVFAFVFLFSTTFAGPKVFVGGEDLKFFLLTAIFPTLNMMPVIWIVFTNDSKITKSLSQIVSAVGATKKVNALKSKFKNLGALGLKLATAKGSQQQDGGSQQSLKKNRKQSVFAPLMGDHYTVEQSIPGFNRADTLNNAFITPAEVRRQKNRKYYSYSIAILVIYCIVAGVRSSYPTQAIGIAITVLLVDLCIYMLSRGFLSWSAGYIAFLMSSVRVCLAATCGEY